MRISSRQSLAILSLGIASVLGLTPTQGQTLQIGAPTIALKSGESTEVGNLYWVENCKSMLTATPEVEILDGPPGVTASVKEAMVLARLQKCARPVKGGKLIISADNIEESSISTLTVRVTYNTRDGDRKRSQVFNLELFP